MRTFCGATVFSAVLGFGAAWADAPEQAAASAIAQRSPVEVAQAALDRSRASLQCRFAFTLQEKGEADAPWATWEADAQHTLEFDPRRGIGERWRIVQNERNIRRTIRRQFNYGGRSDPHTDLLTVTLEGDVSINDLRLLEERPDVWVFEFSPSATSTVNRDAHSFLNKLQGELWVSRSTGSVVRRSLKISEPFESGIGRVNTGIFVREYSETPPGFAFVQGTNQTMSVTVQGRGVDTQGRQRITAVQPICDPAEVRRIAEMEARDEQYERTDREPTTGSRMRRN